MTNNRAKTLITITCVVILSLISWEITASIIYESRMKTLIAKERQSDEIKQKVDFAYYLEARGRVLDAGMWRDTSLEMPDESKLFKARSEEEIERDIRAKGNPWSLFR